MNKIFKISLTKILMLSVLVLGFYAQANAETIDANSTDFLNSVMPIIKSESIMPVERISEGKVGPFVAITGIEANFRKDVRKSYNEAIRSLDRTFQEVQAQYKLDIPVKTQMFEHLTNTASTTKAKYRVYGDHYKNKISGYHGVIEGKISKHLEDYISSRNRREDTIKKVNDDAAGEINAAKIDAAIATGDVNAFVLKARNDFNNNVRNNMKTLGVGIGSFSGSW